MTLSPGQDTLACVVKGHGLVTYPVSKLGSWSESELRFTDVVIPCGHIVSVSACEQRSLLVTCGLDNSVRVWFGQRTSPTLLPCSIYHAFDEVRYHCCFVSYYHQLTRVLK
jgi:hypothetical protein